MEAKANNKGVVCSQAKLLTASTSQQKRQSTALFANAQLFWLCSVFHYCRHRRLYYYTFFVTFPFGSWLFLYIFAGRSNAI
jgi:hypothetical protein